MEIGLILSWLTFSGGVGYLAWERGYSAFGWTALSLVVSPLVAVVILLSKPNLVREAIYEQREKWKHQDKLAALKAIKDRPKEDQQGSKEKTSLLIADELQKLAGLRENGILSELEFLEQKARLLKITGAT